MNTNARRYFPFPRYERSLVAMASLALCVMPALADELAYVPVSGGVTVIDTVTHGASGIPLPSNPSELAITPDGQFIYVTEPGTPGSAGTVAVIATATKAVTANITVGETPAGVSVSPDGQSVYVVNSLGNSVSVIATSTNSVVATIPVGTQPLAVAFTPDGVSAYVTNQGSNTLSVIDTASSTVVNTISLGTSSPRYLVMAPPPSGALLFVSTNNGPIYVINTVYSTVFTTIPVSGNTTGLAVTPDGTQLYVDLATPDGNYSISVIQTSTYRVAATISENAADAPGELAISPDGAYAYVDNTGYWVLSIDSTASHTRVNGVAIEFTTATPLNPGAPVFAPVSSANPSVTLVTVHPVTVVGGTSVEGYVVLNAAAPAGGATVALSSNSTSVVVPASVTVPAGSKTATFSVTTQPVTSSTSVFISGVLNNTTLGALTVTPSTGVTLASVTVDEISIPGGSSATGKVTLTGPAPAGGTVVTLWTNGSPAFVPASVTVQAGSTWATFPVTTNYTAATVSDTITAYLNPASAVALIAITAPAALASVSVNPAVVPYYASATGTVTLTSPAPAGGMLVYLWTNGSPAFVPVSVTIPAGSTTATFPVTTNYTFTTLTSTITAFLNGASTTTKLVVTGDEPPGLASVSVNPATVSGTGTTSGTVTLTMPAPVGGTLVWLWTNGSPAFVPVSVTVPAGSTTATFPVTTIYTASTVPDTITAFLNGMSTTTTITVTP